MASKLRLADQPRSAKSRGKCARLLGVKEPESYGVLLVLAGLVVSVFDSLVSVFSVLVRAGVLTSVLVVFEVLALSPPRPTTRPTATRAMSRFFIVLSFSCANALTRLPRGVGSD